jgi:hypothetical protein
MITNCWKKEKQVVMLSVGRQCCYMLEGGPAGYDAEPMLGIGRLRIQIEIRAICKKNHLQLQDDCGAFNFEMPQYKDRYDGII